MDDYDNINTINDFWEKFKKDILKHVDERQEKSAKTIFYVACSGMYAVLKSNMFEKDNTVRDKIEFMKSIEKEIFDFGDSIFGKEDSTLKH